MKRYGLLTGCVALVLAVLWSAPSTSGQAQGAAAQGPGAQAGQPQQPARGGQPGRGQGGGRGRGGGRGARTRKVVLAWADTRNGLAQHDSVSHALAVIERLGYESGMYDTYIRTDSNIIAKTALMTTGQPASGGPSLSNVDAIFFLGHREVELTDRQKADLMSFVKDDGKGFVAAHTAKIGRAHV